MRRARAEKTGNGWVVVITDTRSFFCESDVKKFLRQEGLTIRPQFNIKKIDEQGKETEEIISIYAD